MYLNPKNLTLRLPLVEWGVEDSDVTLPLQRETSCSCSNVFLEQGDEADGPGLQATHLFGAEIPAAQNMCL